MSLVFREEVSERFGAKVGAMFEQLVEGKAAGGDGEDADGIGAGGLNIARCVTDDADACGGSGERAGLACGIGNEMRTVREIVTESAEAEPLTNAGALEFGPADGLKVAGGYTKDCTAAVEVVEGLLNGGHQIEVEFSAAPGDVIAHGGEDCSSLCVKGGGRNARAETGLAEDGRVSISGERNAFERHFMAENEADGVDEGFKVRTIAAAQECSVDVEEVDIMIVPAETGKGVDAGLRRLGRSVHGSDGNRQPWRMPWRMTP